MNIKNKAKKFHNEECYYKPINEVELAKFAEIILNDFILKLKDNTKTVIWNYGMDSVIFEKELKQLKKDFLCL